MKKTIENYWLNRHVIEMPKKIARPDSASYANLLIAELNDYDCANLSNQYIWHIDNSQGSATLNALMQIIPSKTEYLYILYTNSAKGNRLIRMTQDVWAFPNSKTVSQFFSDMISELNDVQHSHLLAINLAQGNVSEQLIDYYYFNDYSALANKGERYALLSSQANNISHLPYDITPEQFQQVTLYQKHLFEHDAKIIKSGLTNQLRKENKNLIQQRHKLRSSLR